MARQELVLCSCTMLQSHCMNRNCMDMTGEQSQCFAMLQLAYAIDNERQLQGQDINSLVSGSRECIQCITQLLLLLVLSLLALQRL